MAALRILAHVARHPDSAEGYRESSSPVRAPCLDAVIGRPAAHWTTAAALAGLAALCAWAVLAGRPAGAVSAARLVLVASMAILLALSALLALVRVEIGDGRIRTSSRLLRLPLRRFELETKLVARLDVRELADGWLEPHAALVARMADGRALSLIEPLDAIHAAHLRDLANAAL